MDAKTRKQHPLFRGLFKYFPDACMAVANCSWVGNKQHNPGEEMHWAREKSTDHGDCIVRHLLDSASGVRQRAWADSDDRDNGEPSGELLPLGMDSDRVPHVVKCAWRSLALAQIYLEESKKEEEKVHTWTVQGSWDMSKEERVKLNSGLFPPGSHDVTMTFRGKPIP